jgi:hypothetical protein
MSKARNLADLLDASGDVGTNELADGAVTEAKIGTGAVTANKLAAGAAVPSQSGQSGKFLTTDGTDASWATVNTDLVSDTTPQLGGNLDSNGNDIAMGRGDAISWPDASNNPTIKQYGSNHPSAGYAGDNHYWHVLESDGGTHIVLNKGGGRTAGRNNYDHFTVWQNAHDQTNGRMCFSVDNVGGVYMANAGISFDRAWDGNPGIAVHYTSGNGDANYTREFRIHGMHYDAGSWWGGANPPDWACSLRIDGASFLTSDRRKKVNISSVSNALEKVLQLDGKVFQVKNSEGEIQDQLSKNGFRYGFLAQDIEDVVPEAVKHYPSEDDGTENYNNAYSVDYASLVPLLTNAIKEQQAIIEALAARVGALEAA